jgi:ribonuclease P protein component
MRRSADFSAAVKHGTRVAQPDIVLHARQTPDAHGVGHGRRVGLIVAKSVGSAVQRHRVARRLRHITRSVLTDLEAGEHVVIRALPSSRNAISARLEQQLRTGLGRLHDRRGSGR